MVKTMIFARIQRPGLGWNPSHRSKHPRDFTPGVIYQYGDAKHEWETLLGLAAFPLSPLDAARAIFGLDFVLAKKETLPQLMDWEAEGVDALWRSAVEHQYDIFVFTGDVVQELPDGVVVVPRRIPDEELIKWFLKSQNALLSDPQVRKELDGLMDPKHEYTPEECIREMFVLSEWEDEKTGLLIHLPCREQPPGWLF